MTVREDDSGDDRADPWVVATVSNVVTNVPRVGRPTPSRGSTAVARHRCAVPSPLRAVVRRTLFTLAAVIGVGLLGVGADGVAHAQTGDNQLVASTPADGATLGTSPSFLTFSFNQPVRADETFTVAVGCGVPAQPQNTGIPQLADDDLTFNVEVLSPFPKGACTITWLLRDELKQPIATDLIAFSVAADTPGAVTSPGNSQVTTVTVAATALPSATSDVEPVGSTGGALWFGRYVAGTAALAIFGAVMLIIIGWPEGPLYQVTQRFMWVLVGAGTFGGYIHVVALTADLTGRSFGSALSPVTWFDLPSTGLPGTAAVIRLFLIAACGWLAWYPERLYDETSRGLALGLVTATAATTGLSRVEGDLVALGVLVNMVHVLAVGMWIGGALLISRVVLAGPGGEDLVQAVRAHSRYVTPALLVTIVTGLLETYRLAGSAILTSSFGQVLVLKTVVVVILVLVTLALRQQAIAQLRRLREMPARPADRLRRAFGFEATFGIVALAFSGWLLSFNPPKVSQIPERTYDVVVPLDSANGFAATVSVTPLRVGLNEIEVRVTSTPAPISDLTLELDPWIGSYGRGVVQDIPLDGIGIARLSPDAGLPLDVTGEWTLTLSADLVTGATVRMTADLVVSAEDGSAPATTSSTVVVPTSIVDPTATTIVDPPATTIGGDAGSEATIVTTAPVVSAGG